MAGRRRAARHPPLNLSQTVAVARQKAQNAADRQIAGKVPDIRRGDDRFGENRLGREVDPGRIGFAPGFVHAAGAGVLARFDQRTDAGVDFLDPREKVGDASSAQIAGCVRIDEARARDDGDVGSPARANLHRGRTQRGQERLSSRQPEPFCEGRVILPPHPPRVRAEDDRAHSRLGKSQRYGHAEGVEVCQLHAGAGQAWERLREDGRSIKHVENLSAARRRDVHSVR